MSYELNYTFENDYLSIKLKADNNFETSNALWRDLYELSIKYNCKNILVISNSEPLSTMSAYDHASMIKETGITYQYRIAWLEMNPEAREIDKFIENVLANRGIVQAKLFLDEPEAKKWLLR